MRILTADIKIKIRKEKKALTRNTKIKLSQIKDLFKWINDQRGVIAHEGDYSPDHTKRKQGKEWIPAKKYQGKEKTANADLIITSKIEPKGIQSKMNRRIKYSKERLKDVNTGMPKDYGIDKAPDADYELKLSNGESAKAYKKITTIDKYLRPRAINYFNKITQTEAGIISFYTYEGDKLINGALRGKRPMTPKIKQCIETMDKVFKDAPDLGENLVTFRYAKPSELGKLLNDENLSKIEEVQENNKKEIKKLIENHIGDVYPNPAFVSTNVDQEKTSAETFIYRIKHKKTEKALYISPLAYGDFSKPDVARIMENRENELLINRGQKFKVNAVQLDGTRNKVIVDLEVV